MIQVEFHFDFGSPNAYFSHLVIPSIEARTGVTFQYKPVLLGGLFKLANNQPPMVANANIPAKQKYAQRETERFIARHNIKKYKRNPFFPVNTLKIMRGCIAAQELDCFSQYVDVVFSSMWEQEQNMADDQTILNCLNQAGLDGAQILELIQTQHIKDQLVANTDRSFAMGAFGSPTYFVDGDIYFGKDKLDEVEQQIGYLQKCP